MRIPMGLVGLMLMALLMTLALSGCESREEYNRREQYEVGMPNCAKMANAQHIEVFRCDLTDGTYCYVTEVGGIWCK